VIHPSLPRSFHRSLSFTIFINLIPETRYFQILIMDFKSWKIVGSNIFSRSNVFSSSQKCDKIP